MGFEGSLDSVSFADILNTLCRLNKEGVLIVYDDKRKKAIYFRDNGVTLIGGNQRARLGDMLIKTGAIQPRELEAALTEQRETGKLLGEVLIDRRLVTAEEIEEVIADQIEEEICDIFFWENAHFSFEEGPLSEDFAADQTRVSLTFDVQSVLFKIADQIEQWEEFRRQIPSFGIIFVPAEDDDIEIDIPETESQENFEKILQYLDGSNDVNDIIRLTQLSVLTVCRIMSILLSQRAVRAASFDELLSIANEFQKKGQTQKQIRFLEQALQLAPNSKELVLKIAQTYENMGGGKKSGEYYGLLGEQTAKSDPKLAMEYFEKASSYLPRDFLPKEYLLTLAENLEMEEKELYYSKSLATLYCEEKAYEKSVELCTTYLERYPNRLDFRKILVEAYAEMQQPEMAIEECEKIAAIYEQQGNDQGYIEILEQIIQLAPERTDIEKRLNKFRRKLKWEQKRNLVLIGAGVAILLLLLCGFVAKYELSARQAYQTAQALEKQSSYEEARKFYHDVLRDYSWSTVAGPAKKALANVEARLAQEVANNQKQVKKRNAEINKRFAALANLIEQGKFTQAQRELALCRREYPEQMWQKRCDSLEQKMREYQTNRHERQRIAKLELARRYQREGNLEEARKIYLWLEQQGYKVDKKETGKLTNYFRRIKLKQLLSLTNDFFKQALKTQRDGQFDMALELYAKTEKIVNEALEMKLNEDQERKLSHVKRLVEQQKQIIRELERQAAALLSEAQQLAARQEIRQAFAKVQAVLKDDKLKYTKAASRAQLPVRIVSKPGGARIHGTLDKTPQTFWFNWKDIKHGISLKITYPGFEARTLTVNEQSPPINEVVLGKTENWRYRIEGAVYARIATLGNTVILTSRSGRIDALNAGDGQVLWQQRTSTSWGDISAGPRAFMDKIYVGSHDQYLYAIDVRSGRIDWKYKSRGFIKITPVVDARSVFFATTDGYCYALQRWDGSLLWQYKSNTIESSPVLAQEYLIYGNLRSQLFALHLASGSLVWQYQLKGPIAADLALSGKNLFIGTQNGYLYCLNLESQRLRWRKKLQGPIQAAVEISGSDVYAATSKGYVYRISWIQGGRIIWQRQLPAGIYCQPAKVDELLYVGCENSMLYLLDEASGEVFWEKKYGDKGIFSDIVVKSPNIYIASKDGIVHALAKP